MNNVKRVLITGAAGFVGKVAVQQFRAAGMEVVATDRHGHVDLSGDLSDPSFTRSLPSVQAVVHCAAVQYVSADLPLLNRETWFDRNNVRATANLCERYATEPGTHFVNVGTSMMYEQNGASSYKTSSPMNGQGVYSRSKLKAYAHVCAMPNKTATLVPCIIGGIGREGLFRQFVAMAMKHKRVVFPGAGVHPTHMVHVDDVGSLLLKIVQQEAEGLFNAAGTGPLCLNEWVAHIASALGIGSVGIVHMPLMPVKAVASMSAYRLLAAEQLLMLGQPHVLDTRESLALGWAPKYDNATIVKDIANYIATTSSR
jgi:nucleoside-diphosphate-sugar epimerase